MSHDEPTQLGSDPSDRPIIAGDFAWPIARIDPVARMRALTAGMPHCAVRETVFEAEYDRVWKLITDFENGTPRYEGIVNKVKIIERTETRFVITSRMISGLWIESEVLLEPGWCLMNSASGQIGMAAYPESPSTTRLIHFEASTRFSRALRPFFHWNIGGDFKRLRALLK